MIHTEGTVKNSSYGLALAVLMPLFALSLCLNVWLGRSVRATKLAEQTTSIRLREATVGGQPALANLRDLDGTPVSLPRNKAVIIYYYSPTCSWCARNFAGLQSLERQVQSRYQLIGAVSSKDGMDQYGRNHPMSFQTVVVDSPSDVSALALQGTPQTILLTDGKVAHNWVGAFQAGNKDSIQGVLGVSLPDFK